MTTSPADPAPTTLLGRRELLAGAGVAAVAALFAGPARGSLDLLPFIGGDALPFDRVPLTAQIGETFRVASGPDRGATLVLTEIVELATAVADPEQQFAARFTGPAGLPQDMFEFTSRSFGRLPLFLSPVSAPAVAPAVYEAIVNRFVPGASTGGPQS